MSKSLLKKPKKALQSDHGEICHMKWKKLTILTTTDALDYMGAIADELGLEGFEIEDNVPLTEEEKNSMFIDILPELPPDDGSAKVHFYIDEDADAAAIAEDIRKTAAQYAEFCDFGSMEAVYSETEDKDWINNWKQFFKPFRVDDSIVIKPTWEELNDAKDGDLVIEIDPGTAFGTGAHETTKLCILNLKKYLKPGDRLLDVGCGSGILSIVGMKLGAWGAVGIDVDDNATRTSVENADTNDLTAFYASKSDVELLEDQICFATGNVIDDAELREAVGQGCYDVVVANILAPIIIPLSAVVGGFMKPGAYFISSGIINTAEEDVRRALLDNGFEIIAVDHMKDWVSFTARKK